MKQRREGFSSRQFWKLKNNNWDKNGKRGESKQRQRNKNSLEFLQLEPRPCHQLDLTRGAHQRRRHLENGGNRRARQTEVWRRRKAHAFLGAEGSVASSD
jgi:hypothetical protein